MKTETDKYGRRTYKFSSCVCQGGYLYAQKTKVGSINTDGLRNVLTTLTKEYELIDATIKIYEKIFFLFFQMKPSLVPANLINTIQENIGPFGQWNDDYI